MHDVYMVLFEKRSYILTLIFVSFFIFGIMFYDPLLNELSRFGVSKGDVEESIKERFSISEKEVFLVPLIIFINNVIVSLIIFVLGFTVIGPAFVMLYNGVIAGLIIDLSSKEPLLFSQSTFALLVPHGCLEIPLISFIGTSSAIYVLGSKKSFSPRNLLFFITYVLITLAVVETTITPIVSVIDSGVTYVIRLLVSGVH